MESAMRRTARWIALPFALVVAAPASGQNADALDPDDPPAVVHTGADEADRITMPIRIDGKGPYDFIIDTGSQRTVISRELATLLALPADKRVSVLSMTGLADTDSVTVGSLAFGSTSVKAIQAPVFAGDHIGAHGLLGLDGLSRKRLVLNFKTGKMDITPSRQPARSDPDVIIVEARSKFGQLILMDSDADGQNVRVILDTGSEYSVGNAALLKRLAKKKRGALSGPVTMTSVTGAALQGQWGIIGKIRLGNVGLTNVPVVFADASPFKQLGLENKPALLLGVSVLRGFDKVAIDFGRRRVDFLLPDQSAVTGMKLAALER
jgi:predicted aspartyl protease